ncbi:hypothetical protein F4808DRAFT_419759 [Astrocystis sublimbata]|nr:hypothetical protein F4808DRAFT_419759 [Astrocystis sublimbata]
MTDSHDIQASHVESAPAASQQLGQAQDMLNPAQADPGSRTEVHGEAVKDQVDGAMATGPKRADQSSGGRVQVAETGDLHDLAAQRQSEH